MIRLKRVLFEKCPLCGEGTIHIEIRSLFLFSWSKISVCPICSAKFAARGVDAYQLQFCEPSKVIGKRGHGERKCPDRVYRGCYLGATLHKSEWEKIAEGGESNAFEKFLKMSQSFQSGLLPTYPAEAVPVTLESGEVTHYVSSPVYMDEKQPSHGKPVDKGEFILTNRRIVFLRETGILVIPFEKIAKVDEAPPGFVVQEKDSFQPRYFFPPLYDPVFAAVLGAIYNFEKGR